MRERIVRFIREWFLPIAMALGVAIYLLFHNLSALDVVSTWYAPHNNDVLPACMFLVLFTTFCKVDFRQLRPVPWHGYVLIVQTLLAVTLISVIRCWHLDGKALILVESALVCIVCPCASATAVVTAKLGGSLEETSAFTFIANIFSAFLISLFFPMLPQSGAHATLAFLPLFLRILWRVSCVLMLPMLIAFIVKHWWKRLHRAIVTIDDLSFLLWGGALMIVSATTAKNINDSLSWISLHFLLIIAALSLAVCIAQFAIGRLIGSGIKYRAPGEMKTKSVDSKQDVPGEMKTKSVDCGQDVPGEMKTKAVDCGQDVPGALKTKSVDCGQDVPGEMKTKAVDCGQALAQKNTTTAIWVATVFLHPLASVGPGCYILWQNLVNSFELYHHEKALHRTTT